MAEVCLPHRSLSSRMEPTQLAQPWTQWIRAELGVKGSGMEALREICERLLEECHARAVLLFDGAGTVVARAGTMPRFDLAALSALVASKVEAEDGGPELLEKARLGQPRDAETTEVVVVRVAKDSILAVMFDWNSSLGLVRLRLRKATEDLALALERGPSGSGGPPPTASTRSARRG